MSESIGISAVIPTYNRGHLVGRAIESALAQEYGPSEIIVVDDGSSDGTRQVVQSYGEKVRYLYQPNAGVSAARNRGVKEAPIARPNRPGRKIRRRAFGSPKILAGWPASRA